MLIIIICSFTAHTVQYLCRITGMIQEIYIIVTNQQQTTAADKYNWQFKSTTDRCKGPMYFFLSSLPQPPRQCSAPTCHLSTIKTLYRRCRFAHRVHIGGRDAMGGVYLPYQLERTLQLCRNVMVNKVKGGLRSPGIDFKEAIPPIYVAWRNPFLGIDSWAH
jgi:hypothetical protein